MFQSQARERIDLTEVYVSWLIVNIITKGAQELIFQLFDSLEFLVSYL